MIPFHHGETLYELAREPRQLWVVDNARHNQFFSTPENQKLLAERIEKWFG